MSLLGKRYANALLSVAIENKKIDQYKTDLENLVYYYSTVPEFEPFINNPQVTREDKKKVLCKIIGEDSDIKFLNFVQILIDKERFKEIQDIFENYKVLANEYQNIILIKVTSAIKLENEEIEKIKEKYKEEYKGFNLEVENLVDKSILGGLKIQIGDKIIDATLKTRLSDLKEYIISKNKI